VHTGWKLAVFAWGAVHGGLMACNKDAEADKPPVTNTGADATSAKSTTEGTEVGVDAARTELPVTGTGGSAPSGVGTCDILCTLGAESSCDRAVPKPKCVSGCEEDLTGPCASQVQTLLDCVTTRPAVACTAQGIAYFPDCENEQKAFYACRAR
jgi:hypothetical protein